MSNKSLLKHPLWTFAGIAFCIMLFEGVVVGNVAIGQQQQQSQVVNQTASSSSFLNQQQQLLLEGISFEIDNVTFTCHDY